MLLSAAYEPRRGSVAHRFPPQPVPPPRLFCARILRLVCPRRRGPGEHLAISFSADLDYYPSAAWAVKFTEKNALPGAEAKRFVLYQDLFAAAKQRAFAMGIGIALGMAITGAMMGHQLGQGQKYIVGNGRVGVFVYGNCRRCVRTIDYCIAVGNARLADKRANLACDVNHLVTVFCAYAKLFLDDFHYYYLSHLFDNFDTQKLTKAMLNSLCG